MPLIAHMLRLVTVTLVFHRDLLLLQRCCIQRFSFQNPQTWSSSNSNSSTWLMQVQR